MFIFPEKYQEIVALNNWLKDHGPSPHIVPFESVNLTPLFLHAVADVHAMEKWGNPSEYHPLKRGISEEDARPIIRELLRAVRHIHERGIAHGHINLDTVRQHSTTGRIVILEHIIPIGATVPNTVFSKSLLTVAAPEIKRYEPFSYPADIWSIGVILQQLLYADKDFSTADIEDTDLLSPYVSGLNGVTTGFLMICLKSDASDRPSLAELIAHPYASDAKIGTGILDAMTDDDLSNTNSSDDECTEEKTSNESDESEEDSDEGDDDDESLVPSYTKTAAKEEKAAPTDKDNSSSKLSHFLPPI